MSRAAGGEADRVWQRADHIHEGERADDELLGKACAVMADTFGGLHNTNGKVRHYGVLVELITPGDLATFDFDQLTSLVFAAHEHCVRVSVGSAGRYLRVWFHNRQRDGSMSERHPTLAEAWLTRRKLASDEWRVDEITVRPPGYIKRTAPGGDA